MLRRVLLAVLIASMVLGVAPARATEAAGLPPFASGYPIGTSFDDWVRGHVATAFDAAGMTAVATAGSGEDLDVVSGMERPSVTRDVDGDGVRDIITFAASDERYQEVIVRLRSGADGHVLTVTRGTGSYVGAGVLDVGAPAAPALVTVAYAKDLVAQQTAVVGYAGQADITMTVTASDVAGDQRWSLRDVGRAAYAVGPAGASILTINRLPTLAGTGKLTADEGIDLLVAHLSVSGVAVAGTPATTAFAVVDGATGKTACETQGVHHYAARVAGDLNDDTVDDVVTYGNNWLPNVGRAGGSVAAHSGATCTPLWVNSDEATERSSITVEPAEVTGDGVADVVVSAYDKVRRVGVLDGKTGKTLWRRPASQAFVLGDLDDDGDNDVTLIVAEDDGATATYGMVGVTGEGSEIFTADLGSAAGDYRSIYAYRVGDPDGDRVLDLEVVYSGYPASSDRIVSGRRGVLIREGRWDDDTWPVAARDTTFDGVGTDLIRVTDAADAWQLEAVDGATQRLLWSVPLAQRTWFDRYGRVEHATGHVTGDGISEAIVGYTEGTLPYLALFDGRDGRRIWSIAAGGQGDLPPAPATRSAPFRSAPTYDGCYSGYTNGSIVRDTSLCDSSVDADRGNGEISAWATADTGARGTAPAMTTYAWGEGHMRERFMPEATGRYDITATVEVLESQASSAATLGKAIAVSGAELTVERQGDSRYVDGDRATLGAPGETVTLTHRGYWANAGIPITVDVGLNSGVLLYNPDPTAAGVVAGHGSASAKLRILSVTVTPAP